jgi:hypothetical protein
MAGREYTLSIRLPRDLAEELERWLRRAARARVPSPEVPLSTSLRTASTRRAAAVLERDQDQPNLALDKVKRELGLER